MGRTSRTVRFKDDEIILIDEFLTKNPIFDFSSLTRTALMGFIRNPNLVFNAVSERSKKKSSFKKTKEH